jgi:hypothetical protein
MSSAEAADAAVAKLAAAVEARRRMRMNEEDARRS